MSWNKNTINLSEVDTTIKVLKRMGTPYKLTALGRVKALGLNDEGDEVPLKKLEYGDTVVIERIDRTHDCDTNDIINSYEFKKGKEPKKWELETYQDD